MIQRDYIERLIQQAIQGLVQAAELIKRGELNPARILVDRTIDQVLGSLRPAFERLDATSAVALVGPSELARVRLYAALLAEMGALDEVSGKQTSAGHLYRRALDFYEAGERSGMRLLPADSERIIDLRLRVEPGGS